VTLEMKKKLAGFKNSNRKINKLPIKVLDAPALQDDFYLNLLDWSSHNYLAVGLATTVYLWNAANSKVTKLCDLGIHNIATSVSCSNQTSHLALGTNNGEVQIWDV
jgi:cell division cycle 20-like protein 1, cofactor of APC complex